MCIRDRNNQSGHKVREEATCFDQESKTWRLRHTAEDQERGLRGYIVDIMDVLKCHQSFDLSDDKAGLLRQYVTKYLSKFSDSASDEWLDDDQSALNIATMVLMRYKPFEPEMVLQLFGQRFRQWHMSTVSGGKRDFVVPVPDQAEQPKEVEQYMKASWACGKISLLDFLRKTTNQGSICHWLKKLHKASDKDESLDKFAANYKMNGEKVVAAEMLSRRNDRFYGQWLMLHKPFHSPEDFIQKDVLEKVPDELRYMTMALSLIHI